jgi:hypothetical protein
LLSCFLAQPTPASGIPLLAFHHLRHILAQTRQHMHQQSLINVSGVLLCPAVNFLLGQPPAPVQLQNASIVTVTGSQAVNLHGISW